MVVERKELKDRLARLLDYGRAAQRPANGRGVAAPESPAPSETRA
jgi:hypothetical protein